MRSQIQFLFYTCLFVSSVWCSPISLQKRSFKVSRIRQANYVPNGPKALKKAFVKFGFDDISFLPQAPTTENVGTSSSVKGDEEGDVSASPTQNDAEFLSPVMVGGQTLVMDFDTGSSDMWVFNTNLPASSQQGHTIYDPNQSSTFQLLEDNEFDISYGDGSGASGPVGLDTVNIGGAVVQQQAIGLPTEVSDSFVSDTSSNGLVGLAFSVLNTVKPEQQKTFFANVLSSLAQPVFTANLKHGTVGAYEFGAIDTTAFTGSLSTVDVDSSQGFWAFDFPAASVNGNSTDVPGGSAIADTGTSLLLLDPSVVDLYYSQVEGASESEQDGGVIFPCDSDLPDLQLAMGDSYTATISGDLMNFSDAVGGDGQCFGGLQSNAGLGFSIFGDVFFKSQFVVFDGNAPALMVAPHS